MIAESLGIKNQPDGDGYAQPKAIKMDSVVWKSKNPEKTLEDIIGLSFKDALPILENKGYRVRYSGFGKVKSYAIVGKNIIALVLD